MTRESHESPQPADDGAEGGHTVGTVAERRDPLALRRTLGHRIRTWRQRRAVSQADLAEHVGVTQSSLSNYENGKRDVSVYILMEIARVLEVDLEDLTGSFGRRRQPVPDGPSHSTHED